MGKKSKRETETPCKDTFEPLPIESKLPATVVLLLSSPEEDVLLKACEAIYKFADKGDENKVALLGLGALEPLCQLIVHNNKLVRRNAFMALGIMATNGDVKNALKKVDVIPSIIEKLSLEEDTVVHEFATLCLASLSVDFVCKVQIFDKEGLPPLIQLLSSSDPDVTKNTLETIFNLVQDYPSLQALHELGGIPPLLELLKSDFPLIQQLALKTLENVTTDKDTCTTFREEQGFEKLMDFLSNKDFNDLHVEALQVVANCVGDSESLQLIHQGGGLTRLMEFVLAPSMPEIQSNAVKCITKVAQGAENRKLLHEQDVEKALVELLSAEGDSVKTAACHAVAAMSLHRASKDSFRDLDGIRAVVQLLSSESWALREAAAQALANLTHSNQLNACAVYEAGGHETLVQQLHDGCPGTVAHAAAALANMAKQEVLRCGILSHGAARALVEPLKSADTHILVHATLCLAVLACNAEARAELRNAGGLAPLVNLLCSNHKDVRHNACWAVSVCASDEPTAVEMCKFGALELLQEINQSVNRRSRFSELAMARLLDFNLSVKYSLTGRLASTDITTDGFYDVGQVRAGQQVLTLEELSKQPVNQRRPIIAVNIAADQRPFVSLYSKWKWKEDDKHKDEEGSKAQHEKPWAMMFDASLKVLVTEATKSILPLSDESEQYAALARLVSEAMGGAVEVDRLHEFPWELHLSELKFELHSNVVPIGRISKGIYCHRAMLFKCLADRIGVSCTLVRGEYNRAWNEVLIIPGAPSTPGCSPQPCRYIVDLMHQPGSLLKASTPAAIQYQTI
ncbi:armadillo repeat-containing protein 3 [Centroberyx affinis]|uniref:armadillo repeat-containing protein 3 n=1 Tax=Centroberyx affinis TaxID=166261 RepID=UPI003A5BD156